MIEKPPALSKGDLIAEAARHSQHTKETVSVVLEAVLEIIAVNLGRDNRVSLHGFGSFTTRERPARITTMPHSDEPIHLSAHKTVKFTPFSALKNRLHDKHDDSSD